MGNWNEHRERSISLLLFRSIQALNFNINFKSLFCYFSPLIRQCCCLECISACESIICVETASITHRHEPRMKFVTLDTHADTREDPKKEWGPPPPRWWGARTRELSAYLEKKCNCLFPELGKISCSSQRGRGITLLFLSHSIHIFPLSLPNRYWVLLLFLSPKGGREKRRWLR